ncbi:MAG TPA: hypothetical protein VFH78_01545 [Candidatus Thermoplasmatota archaeon]|nr:hypothetical protein [Candidatus Thermoplasmatota archaeon]
MDKRLARAVVVSMLVPGLAHLVHGRRTTEGALLLTFTFLWGVLGVIQLATFWAHFPHVGHDAIPGLIAQFVLYGALLPVVGAFASVGLVDAMRRG